MLFRSYGVPLKRCVVRALESAGYSKYTARIVASGEVSGVVAWSKLSKAVLGSDPSVEEIRACLVLGTRVGGGKSFLEQLVGDSIKTKASEHLGGAEYRMQASGAAERKGRIKRANAFLNSARTRHVTEAQWVEYYDRCFDVGEMEAVQALAKITGDTF